MLDNVQAHDLVQDTLKKAIGNSDSFQPGTNIAAWLHRILRNTHISNMRRGKEDATGDMILVSPSSAVQSPQMPRLELRDLSQALDRLPAGQREAILLSALHDLSYEEIAATTSTGVGTVKSRICRGRQTLRSLMADTGPEASRTA